ncbi:hypothetical protein SeMB42_g00702 [Synchytrium endobioticum]|uniref:RRM domain-containing protein n=1 Tax=Synchytrium endobioticum TaxID=286115 RepID=A0A507DPT0_9FUNG|nr:hypothetical protein SeLEV6574_g02134 [Synchytrium endobioticum]TPX53603.1 hypothetical protein SeMB42_g00702 [Synchytrium endobioticum]
MEQKKSCLLDLVERRLYINGLIPNTSAEDLEQFLTPFGEVKAVDVAKSQIQPSQCRGFAHISLLCTAKQLARCFHLYNGSKWKGTAVHLALAKPGFRKRLESERRSIAMSTAHLKSRVKKKHVRKPDEARSKALKRKSKFLHAPASNTPVTKLTWCLNDAEPVVSVSSVATKSDPSPPSHVQDKWDALLAIAAGL